MRWSFTVLSALHLNGPIGFNALRRRVGGVSEKMLSQTLRVLRQDGFVRKDDHPFAVHQVEYGLTALGRSTTTMMIELLEHLEAHLPAAVLRRTDTGR